jgi:hypothetical protein
MRYLKNPLIGGFTYKLTKIGQSGFEDYVLKFSQALVSRWISSFALGYIQTI